MELNDSQKKQIERYLTTSCPLCGGKFLYSTKPLQLISFSCPTQQEGFFNDNNIDDRRSYICGECQNCGYTVLRSINVLLKGELIDAEKQTSLSETANSVETQISKATTAHTQNNDATTEPLTQTEQTDREQNITKITE